MLQPSVKTDQLSHVKALIKLSGFDKTVTPKAIMQLAKDAPDPETIARAVLKRMHSDSPALAEKWRKTLGALWAHHHPDVPVLPDLPLTKRQAISTFLLLDALNILDALSHKPARLTTHHGQTQLHNRENIRLAHTLESLEGEPGDQLNPTTEARLMRLTQCLTAAHLLRPYRGQLHVVRSRLKAFLRLPRSYQWFVLWHTDVYHVSWGELTPEWHDELHLIQDYLPLLWEVSGVTAPDISIDKQAWCMNVIEAFAPLWAEEGLMPIRSRWPLLALFQDSTLGSVINQLIVNDLLARYGLIQFEASGNFVWTPLGVSLLQAEKNHNLPCGLELI